jgi:PAS domain S-box-containing protein
MVRLQLVPFARRALLWLGVAAAYVAGARLSVHWGFRDGVALVGLEQSVAFTAVQLGGPWLAGAVAIGGIAEGLREGLPLSSTLLLGAGAAATGLAALVVTRSARLQLGGERVGDTFIRASGAAAAAIVGSSFGLAALEAAHRRPDPARTWGILVLSNLAGILVVSPFVRAWVQRRSRGVARLPEWCAILLAAAALGTLMSAGRLGTYGPTAYILFPVVVWAALRAGRMGVSAVLVIAALILTENTTRGHGPFAARTQLESAVALDAFLVVLALTGLVVVGLELERRVIATGLSEAEDRHRRLIEQLPLVTYQRSLDATVGEPYVVSPQTVDLLGYPLEAWLAQPYFGATLVHPEDRAVHAALNARSLKEDVVRGEYRMIASDGRVVWVLDHMAIVRDEAGRPVAQQGFVVDITDRKQLEDQLVRAQRIEALGLLAGGVAHDFNNLLTAISGYTQLATDQVGKADDLARRHLAEVRTASERAAELTRRLLAFGNRQVLERAVVDLNELVLEAQQQLARVTGATIALVTELDPALPRVKGDRGQLGQVLANLAANACDAMPDGGTLTIRTTAEDGDAVLSVSDTGVGMEEETRARIFEPFFTTKEVGEGAGLGLAMVHGIVQQSEGRLSVESDPGRGTTFRLILPATDALPQPKAGRPAPVDGGGSETVLLVDDEDVVRRLTAEMLERHGYRVVTAAGPDEALLVTEPWDMLLTDVVMPVMSGPELAERLVSQRPDVGLLFTSGYSGAAVADRSALGADLLEKPFTLEELGRKVRAALDARRAS